MRDQGSGSLKVLEDVLEGAARLLGLLGEVEEALLCLGEVRLPLGLVDNIVFGSLMAEVHVLVTPVRCGELGLANHLANLRLGAAELGRCTPCVDIVEDRFCRNGSKSILPLNGTLFLSIREHEFSGGLEAQVPWEDNVCLLVSVLVVLGKVGHTHACDVVAGSSESHLEGLQGDTLGIWNMGSEIISEPVHGILTVDRPHRDKVGGVTTITEELDAHARGHLGSLDILRVGATPASVTGVATLEDASVRVISSASPLDLSDATDSVDGLVAAAVPLAFKLVAWSVEDGVLVDDERASQVPSR